MRHVVLCFSGLDPSGGAGIQADIETFNHYNIHCTPILTCNTIQDTSGVYGCHLVDSEFLATQARHIIQDFNISAIKIGFIGHIDLIHTLCEIIAQLRHPVPIVLDPICASGAGNNLVDQNYIDALITYLLPYVTLLTPNYSELKRLGKDKCPQSACHNLFSHFHGKILLTCTDNSRGPNITHQLYSMDGLDDQFEFRRLPHHYHGSGCTLASAITALLSYELPLEEAVLEALNFSYATLIEAQPLGYGQWIPTRNLEPSNTRVFVAQDAAND